VGAQKERRHAIARAVELADEVAAVAANLLGGAVETAFWFLLLALA